MDPIDQKLPIIGKVRTLSILPKSNTFVIYSFVFLDYFKHKYTHTHTHTHTNDIISSIIKIH